MKSANHLNQPIHDESLEERYKKMWNKIGMLWYGYPFFTFFIFIIFFDFINKYFNNQFYSEFREILSKSFIYDYYNEFPFSRSIFIHISAALFTTVVFITCIFLYHAQLFKINIELRRKKSKKAKKSKIILDGIALYAFFYPFAIGLVIVGFWGSFLANIVIGQRMSSSH